MTNNTWNHIAEVFEISQHILGKHLDTYSHRIFLENSSNIELETFQQLNHIWLVINTMPVNGVAQT